MALGIDLEPGQAALRCNLVSVVDGAMRSYAGGNIHSVESHPIIADLNAALGDSRVAFHPGVNFRHILTVRDGADLLATCCAAPHDITDRAVADHLPEGPAAGLLVDLMERSRVLLATHPVNLARVARGDLPVTQIWPFWPGLQAVVMPGFTQTYGRRAALTSAVDLLRGLAQQASIDFLDLAGVTDGDDNDYEAQMAGALAALHDHDVVIVHVEAPDAAGHEGDAAKKVAAVERVDALMVPQVTALGEGARLLVQPDHPTPLALKTHVVEPVPFVLWGAGVEANGSTAYSEAQAAATGLLVAPGYRLMAMFLDGVRDAV
jgi:2,3-bisphosphoglycerate-independent phosphoglycerate mutase